MAFGPFVAGVRLTQLSCCLVACPCSAAAVWPTRAVVGSACRSIADKHSFLSASYDGCMPGVCVCALLLQLLVGGGGAGMYCRVVLWRIQGIWHGPDPV